MNDQKDLLASKTTWGVLIALLAPLLSKYFNFTPELQAMLSSDLAQIVGLVLAGWGQLSRKASITSVAGIPLNKPPTTPPVIFIGFLALGMALLVGCAGKPLLTEGTSPAERAAEAITQAEVGLTIAYRAVAEEAARGVLTKAELTDFLGKLDKASGILTKAQALRRDGLFADSIKEALQSKSLLGTVNGLLAERIKQQRPKT
jgi:hypothetical protein